VLFKKGVDKSSEDVEVFGFSKLSPASFVVVSVKYCVEELFDWLFSIVSSTRSLISSKCSSSDVLLDVDTVNSTSELLVELLRLPAAH